MYNKSLPQNIRLWLNQRGISDIIIDKYEITFADGRIVIPVHDSNGNIIFRKHRRNPESDEGPKYKYDFGSNSALYGREDAGESYAVICEGEFDCLALRSRDIPAYSSTGGSGTFEKSWAERFANKDVYICYDNDDAGIKGAFKVQGIIPHAKIIWLPSEVGEHGDITDFFTKLNKSTDDFHSLRNTAQSYRTPADWKSSKTKKEMNEFKVLYAVQMDYLLRIARGLRSEYKSDKNIMALNEMYLEKYNEVNHALKFFKKRVTNDNVDRLARAKAVPIPQFINFNADNTARCIWHHEKTPSMYYYEKQNRVKCFGCDKLGDVIDVVMELNKVTLTEALKIILNEQ